MKRGKILEAKTTQDKILATAVELLAKNHFANVSMGDIAKACNLTKPSIYYHFNSKKGLYLELARRMLKQIRAELAEITDTDLSLRETLLLIVRMRFESLRKKPDLVRAHFAFIFNRDIRDLIESLQDDIMALQQAIVPKFTQAIENGEIESGTDPVLISIMFHSTLNTYLLRVLHGCSRFEELPEPERFVDIIFNGISIRGEDK